MLQSMFNFVLVDTILLTVKEFFISVQRCDVVKFTEFNEPECLVLSIRNFVRNLETTLRHNLLLQGQP